MKNNIVVLAPSPSAKKILKIEIFYLAVIASLLTATISCNHEDKKSSGEQQNTIEKSQNAEGSQDEPEDEEKENNEDTTTQSQESTPQKEEIDNHPCSAAQEVNNLKTIEEAIQLINTLSHPVGIPCFISALPKPLIINATTSTLSVQPALGKDNPRFFIFLNKLLISFVPTGEGSEVVEFSYLISDYQSIKGEIAFPVTKELSESAAYERILNEAKTNTTCSACHAGESPASNEFANGAFISKAIKPFSKNQLDREALEALQDSCQNDISERCQIINAVMKSGNFLMTDFPSDMPTLF
ncbi:MAG: hypothetical protein R3B45_06665 [Bdellovibrionota bacterium]